jgi:hypothetical protein
MKTDIASNSPEVRNARGEWRPPYAIQYAPVFVWPPKPLSFLKWIVTWPGFMWPTNLGLFLLSTLSWFYTQPVLTRCVHFKLDWICQIYVRNLGLMWLVYGGYYFYLYILKAEGTETKYDVRWPSKKSRMFLFNNQVYDNVFWTCAIGGGDLDRLRSHHSMALCQPLHSVSGLEAASRLVRPLDICHSILARISFLLGSPAYTLEAAV